MNTFILISAILFYFSLASCLIVFLFAVRTRNAPDTKLCQEAEKDAYTPTITLETMAKAEASAADDYEAAGIKIDLTMHDFNEIDNIYDQ